MPYMKINVIPSNKFGLFSAAICALMFAFSHNATALTIGDTQELGQVEYGIPTGDEYKTQYVNFMIGLPLNGSGHLIIDGHDNLITRSNNDFGALPTAVLALTGTGVNINLGAQGTYDYLFAKYDGPNKGSEVWYVGNLSGMITIPATWSKYGLSGWALFSGAGVPDGGATVMLLGAALGALGVVRRYLTR